MFDATVTPLFCSESVTVPVHQWTRLDFRCDATAARRDGLCVELEFPASFLSAAMARVRVTDVALWPAQYSEPVRRSSAVEAAWAQRFFQRHDARRTNAIGRAMVCNRARIAFPLSPFRRCGPSPQSLLPQERCGSECVYDRGNSRKRGLIYDVPYRARSSAILRATKQHHGLRDGYLTFCGYRGAIFLEAEL